MTRLWVVLLLLVLSGCEEHPKVISYVESSDIPTLRAFERACLEQPRRFVYLKKYTGRETWELRWRMQCMENTDVETW